MTLRILHDCDPGNDDALAILTAAAHPALDLVAVTTGAGHLDAARTARNAAIALSFVPRPIPVSAGAPNPLVRERLIAAVLDQTSALDPERPDLGAIALDPRASVELTADTLRKAETTIVCTGPLTNLALVLRTHPDLASRIKQVVVLGGAWGLGNKTAAAEWNMLCDPEAAAIVFAAGLSLRLIPLDVTPQLGIDPQLSEEAEAPDTPAAHFAAELLRSLVLTFRPGLLGPPLMPLNDPVAPLLAAEPDLARWAPARVEVELAGRHTYGRTVVDFAARTGPANCEVAVALDAPRLRAAFLDALRRL